MSYEIIYNAQFLKTSKGKVVPVILSGSNNVWESGSNKRARDWSCWAFPVSTHRLDYEVKELPEVLKECTETDDYVKIHGKWASTKQYRSFIVNCAKKAKTIEELDASDYPEAFIAVWKNRDHSVEGKRTLRSTADLELFIQEAEYRKSKLEDGESIYPTIQFWREKLLHQYTGRQRKERPRLTEFYALSVVKGTTKYFVCKLSARALRYAYSPEYAKQFKTEQEALKWLSDRSIKFRFRIECIPEFIKI